MSFDFVRKIEEVIIFFCRFADANDFLLVMFDPETIEELKSDCGQIVAAMVAHFYITTFLFTISKGVKLSRSRDASPSTSLNYLQTLEALIGDYFLRSGIS